jgi:hypothetical protein
MTAAVEPTTVDEQTPASLSQDVGLALGAQAGEARIRKVVEQAGFTHFRRVAETPFNLVYETRP